MTTAQFQHRLIKGTTPLCTTPLTLLMLHGTGGTENDLIPIAMNLAPNAGVISPRGKVLENGMPRFFKRLAEGVFDVPDLIARTHELADWLEAMYVEHELSAGNVVAVGYSNGANIASSLMMLRPSALAGAVLIRPMVPMVPEPLPRLDGKRALILSGAFDPIAPKTQIDALEQLLRKCGVSVTTHVAEASHGLVKDDVDVAKAWLTPWTP
jgi:phospholipase/carboxylesterase